MPASVAEAMQVITAQEQELDNLRKTLWVQSKTRGDKRERAKLVKAFRAEQAAKNLFESPNTLRTLRDLQSRTGEPSANTGYMWAFLFVMPVDQEFTLSTGVDPDDFDSDDEPLEDSIFEEDDLAPKPARGTTFPDDGRHVSHECWLMAEKIVSADLSFRIILPFHGKHVILAVGASHDILVDEAHTMKLQMRLQETKGTMAFNKELVRYFGEYRIRFCPPATHIVISLARTSTEA
jgi:hypothetical protein